MDIVEIIKDLAVRKLTLVYFDHKRQHRYLNVMFEDDAENIISIQQTSDLEMFLLNLRMVRSIKRIPTNNYTIEKNKMWKLLGLQVGETYEIKLKYIIGKNLRIKFQD